MQALVLSKDNFDARIYLSVEAIAEIKYWQENIKFYNGKNIRPRKIEHYIETDASKAGWGAQFEGTKTGGRWTKSESSLILIF